MSMKFTENVVGSEKQILMFPNHYVAMPQLFEKDSALSTTVDGKKIIKAGTIYPANDSTAVGVVLSDLDVTNGDCNGAVVIHGFVKTDALPAAPTANAISAMNNIVFMPIKKSVITASTTVIDSTDYTKKVTITLFGTDFLSAAETTSNWTLTDTDTTNVVIDSVSKKSANTVEITFKTDTSKTAAAGKLTVAAGTSAVANGVASNAIEFNVTTA